MTGERGLPGAVVADLRTDHAGGIVDQHDADQIARLRALPELVLLRQTLLECQADEVAHRDEAEAGAHLAGGGQPADRLHRGWAWLVQAGSQAAVAVCRRV